jgi:mycothiol synthase
VDLAAGYRLRAPTSDDLDAVTTVLVADELDDVGEVVLGEDFVRNGWGRPGFDLARDAWVATDATGEVVGYGQVMPESVSVGSWGVVHPAHRGRGVGSALLGHIEERALALLQGSPSGRFRHSINADDGAAAALLEARGLRPIRYFWHMRLDLTGPVEIGAGPADIDIRPFDRVRDLAAVHAVLEEAFAEDLGHQPEPFDRWVQEETGGPAYDPTLWQVATEDGRAVGVLTASVFADRGWVDYLAVLAPYRGRGIGAGLLARGFAAFGVRGVPKAFVAVDSENPTGATALYERMGMRVVKRWDLWERTR